MNRRDFLALRMTRHGRTLELSCQGLYMRCLEVKPCEVEAADAYEPWMGEPPTVWARPSADELLTRLREDLRDVQRLRVMESEWLESTSLGDRVRPLLAAFRAQGGQVEFRSGSEAIGE